MRVGYACSYDDEEGIAGQERALRKVGCQQILSDAGRDAGVLPTVLDECDTGTVLIVTRLDRLSRSLDDLRLILARLRARTITVVALDEALEIAPLQRGPALAPPDHDHHDHGHEHSPRTGPVQRSPLRISLFAAGVLAAIWILYTVCFTLPYYVAYTGRVLGITNANPVNGVASQQVRVVVTSGNLTGKTYTLPHSYDSEFPVGRYSTGDNVLLTYNATTQDVGLYDQDRRGWVFLLVLGFVAVTLLVAGNQGMRSLIGMVLSLLIIGIFAVPRILQGQDPLLLVCLAALVIIPLTYYLAHGFNRKTTVAIVATGITLALTTLLAIAFVHLVKIPAAIDYEAKPLYRTYSGSLLNIQSLTLAAFVVSSLAVLNDITISQASIVTSLYRSNPALDLRSLVLHAMDVGKDHVASLVNTLILVYIGVSFPLFLLDVRSVAAGAFDMNNADMALEIVRTLVPSIGIVAAVPITTLLAAWLTTRKVLEA